MNHIAAGNREHRRSAQKFIAQENAKWPNELKVWPREDWPNPSASVSRVLRSKTFLVQEYAADAPAIVRLSVNRAAISNDGGWQQDITWEELQRLKREAGYGDFEAVEVFPTDENVVNVANMRHLWILPAGSLAFAWRKP